MALKLLALFGFAPRDTQVSKPPILGWLILGALSWYAAQIIEMLARWLGPTFSVYMRMLGVFAVALMLHALYRALIHQDDNSWGGWIRKQITN